MGLSHRIYAAVVIFIAGVMPPMPMLGLSEVVPLIRTALRLS